MMYSSVHCTYFTVNYNKIQEYFCTKRVGAASFSEIDFVPWKAKGASFGVEPMSSQMLNVIFGPGSCCKKNSRLGQALAVIWSPKTLTAAKSNHTNHYLSSLHFSQLKIKIIYCPVLLGCALGDSLQIF